MAASTEALIGDQIVTDLNANFSASLTAQRVYDPMPHLDNASSLKALVVALEESSERSSRVTFTRDLIISIGLVQRLPQGTDPATSTKITAIDNLNGVAESVADWFRSQRIYSYQSHALMEVVRQQPQQVYPEGLRMGIFFSSVNLTFRKF